ncbi:MAG: S-layer homology domain-containing protein, partial [Alphaproteobacteria bacterium]|nr:S-layer homology domain-containing protein [Alphaproteobacteria bacterium]
MKKLLVGLFAAGVVAMSTTVPTFAANISDVSANYWASKEINNVVDNNVMTLTGKKFNPEGSVSRVEFVQALLKVLTNDNLNVRIKNTFSDVNASDSYYADVLRSQQLGLVYGYPDGTFKPGKLMSRAETQSVISHITKDMKADTSLLKNFSDYSEVPSWAKNAYAKTLNYGIYVNYPNPSELRPNDVLSRAEAAVILYRLRLKAGLIKSQFVGSELEKVL